MSPRIGKTRQYLRGKFQLFDKNIMYITFQAVINNMQTGPGAFQCNMFGRPRRFNFLYINKFCSLAAETTYRLMTHTVSSRKWQKIVGYLHMFGLCCAVGLGEHNVSFFLSQPSPSNCCNIDRIANMVWQAMNICTYRLKWHGIMKAGQ